MLEAGVRVNTALKCYPRGLDCGLPPVVSLPIPDRTDLHNGGVSKKAGGGPGLA